MYTVHIFKSYPSVNKVSFDWTDRLLTPLCGASLTANVILTVLTVSTCIYLSLCVNNIVSIRRTAVQWSENEGKLITVFYLPTDAQSSCFKRILKFTLKQLLHVSVQSPSSGSVLFELAKVIVIKIIS